MELQLPELSGKIYYLMSVVCFPLVYKFHNSDFVPSSIVCLFALDYKLYCRVNLSLLLILRIR